MSWATHDVEPYVIKRHVARLERRIGFKLSFMAILLGSWGPDLMTKWIVYGVKLGGFEINVDVDQGKVIGIYYAGFNNPGDAAMSFAVPIRFVKELIGPQQVMK